VKTALLALGAALTLLTPAAAAAQEDTAPQPNEVGRVVEIRVEGDGSALQRVRITARELLLRLDVEPRVRAVDEPETPSSEPTPLVIAYLDLRSVSSPSIDIEDGKTRQELTRRHLSDVTSLETGVEALLHVLYLAVESALQVGAERPPPRRVDKKPVPPARARPLPERSHLGFDLGPLLRLSSLGGSRLVPGGGALLEPRVDVGSGQLGLQASLALHGTSELAFARGEASVRPLQARIVPTYDWLFSPELAGTVGLGVGLDALMVEPVQPPLIGRVAPPQSTLDPVVTGQLGARLPLSGRVFLSALASLDLDLAPTSFVAHEGMQTHPVLVLPRWRGGFTLALSFTAAGSRRFSTLGAKQ
jgi:hypothetical protein